MNRNLHNAAAWFMAIKFKPTALCYNKLIEVEAYCYRYIKRAEQL